MSREHKRPLFAFVAVSMLCMLMLGHAIRSDALLDLRPPSPTAFAAAPAAGGAAPTPTVSTVDGTQVDPSAREDMPAAEPAAKARPVRPAETPSAVAVAVPTHAVAVAPTSVPTVAVSVPTPQPQPVDDAKSQGTEKAVEQAAKGQEQAAKAQEEAAKEGEKDSEEAAKSAKEAEPPTVKVREAAKQAEKAQDDAAHEGEKAAEEAAKESEKVADEASQASAPGQQG